MSASAATSEKGEALRESILPLAAVRSHCRIDDVETVTDEVLKLYREAAFDTAALYVDIDLDPDPYTVETVPFPNNPKAHTLRYPAVDGIVTVDMGGGRAFNLVIPPGTQTVVVGPGVPVPGANPLDCAICDSAPSTIPSNYLGIPEQPISLRYKSSACSGPSVPAGVKIGMLQMISWLVGHPGDSQDAAAAARSSGAMATFRRHRREIGF